MFVCPVIFLAYRDSCGNYPSHPLPLYLVRELAVVVVSAVWASLSARQPDGSLTGVGRRGGAQQWPDQVDHEAQRPGQLAPVDVGPCEARVDGEGLLPATHHPLGQAPTTNQVIQKTYKLGIN